ncbi:type II toxin-antitoxin system HicA family toxin [Synechocystis salina]|uniref:Type II toxin-antitoxin system HicA family toxin n=1 Tax=Synechocystis salina LEGE 00031 TaxID=1828736 RepID=A0ABR9VUS6_9SYNC|nr:type II toxin-antitoxin system HicA family toxin [Synechocystis salina]MBE9241527.1 type II toxin-antitoxin system HicA family toxin [Synechocystis salina LEGE 00041]MBE9254801.1 type II toxin-antitoxin system HicA family toxin [Synechocystis salina LEGE 00031]
MKSLSGKEFAKILESNGWSLVRINGSHHIYKKEGQNERISVPIHGNQDLKIGLLRHFIPLSSKWVN